MATIFDVSKAPWRGEMVPASFRACRFFVEANAKEGGRRMVLHEFPKRDYPYAEDMGRKAQEFSVRGYLITYPINTAITPYTTDYRQPRDELINALDAGQAGLLQLPTQAPIWVVCPRYRLTEEEKFGGYCVIDMTFVEYGLTNPVDQPQTSQNVLDAASAAISIALQELANPVQ